MIRGGGGDSHLGSILKHASDDNVTASTIHTHHDYIVPEFNMFARQFTVRRVRIFYYM